jgi:hypothetical protein
MQLDIGSLRSDRVAEKAATAVPETRFPSPGWKLSINAVFCWQGGMPSLVDPLPAAGAFYQHKQVLLC